MDSIHKTIKDIVSFKEGKEYESGFLFTLLVVDKVVKKGIPVAFLACKSESQWVFVFGMGTKHLSSSFRLFTIWMLWALFPNIIGFRSRHGCSGSRRVWVENRRIHGRLRRARVHCHRCGLSFSKIYYCAFHVGQLWEKHLVKFNPVVWTSSILYLLNEPFHKYQRLTPLHTLSLFSRLDCINFHEVDSLEMRSLLNAVRKAKDLVSQRAAWINSKTMYPGAKTLIKYIEKNWLNNHEVLRKWAVYYRAVSVSRRVNGMDLWEISFSYKVLFVLIVILFSFSRKTKKLPPITG